MDIEKRIKEVLAKNKSTLRSLCQQINIPESSLYRMFERQDYKLSTLQIIADSLSISLTSLLEGVDYTDEPRDNKTYELIKAQFEELKRINNLNEGIVETYKTSTNLYKNSCTFLEKERDKLEKKLDKLESENNRLIAQIRLLNDKIQDLESKLNKK